MNFTQLEELTNNQRMLEAQTYKDYSTKEQEARYAYLTYYDTYMSKFDTNALLLGIQEKNEAITDLNQRMKDMIDTDPNTRNYLFELYSLHVQKLTREKQIIELIIKIRHNEKEENNQFSIER